MYTRNSAFMANDDDKRGTLEPGKLADLAVLSSDYLSAPVQEIGKIRSLLTMVGGKVVHAARHWGTDADRTSVAGATSRQLTSLPFLKASRRGASLPRAAESDTGR